VKRTPALLTFLALYLKMNHILGDSSKLSDDEVSLAILDACDVTEESKPKTEEDFYRLGCQYVLCKEAFEAAQAEFMKEHRSIYGDGE
jgi:spore coat polysaccharide biosynthesis predicted glycosyltransferase SpsG